MRAVFLLLVFLATLVQSCSILSVQLTDFGGPRDATYHTSRMTLMACIAAPGTKPEKAGCLSGANTTTIGVDFPLLFLVADYSDDEPFDIIFSIYENETPVEHYRMNNITLRSLTDPLHFNFNFRSSQHYIAGFRFRLFPDKNCRDQSAVYISNKLLAECGTFCLVSAGIVTGVGGLLTLICCCACCYCACCKKQKTAHYPFVIETSPGRTSGTKSGTSSSVWAFDKPVISSPLEASTSIDQAAMVTFSNIAVCPGTPV